MKRSDIGVADKNLWIAAEYLRLEIWNHSRCAIAACSTDHGFDARIEPHAHEVCGASFVLPASESPHLHDVGIEYHFIAGALECFHSAREMTFPRRIRWRNNSNRLASGDCGRTNQPRFRGQIFQQRGMMKRDPIAIARLRDMPDSTVKLSLIHISEPTRLLSISYAVFCLK